MNRRRRIRTWRRTPTSVTTFYNGACPFCSREVANYRRAAAGACDLLWRDVATCPRALACFGVDYDEACRRLHVVDRSGALHSGVDAFIVVWRELPRYRWLARVIGTPGVHGVACLAYDRVLVPTLHSWNARRAARVG